MTDEQNNFPCKCGHSLELDYDYEKVQGNWVWLEDVREEVWQEDRYPYSVCDGCGPYDCQFEQMTNLDYLEWKYEQSREI